MQTFLPQTRTPPQSLSTLQVFAPSLSNPLSVLPLSALTLSPMATGKSVPHALVAIKKTKEQLRKNRRENSDMAWSLSIVVLRAMPFPTAVQSGPPRFRQRLCTRRACPSAHGISHARQIASVFSRFCKDSWTCSYTVTGGASRCCGFRCCSSCIGSSGRPRSSCSSCLRAIPLPR